MSCFQQTSETLSSACKTINVQISQEDLVLLKNGKYMLCVARKVKNHDYNVIWQAYQDYMINNQFMLYSRYAAFGSQYFVNNSDVFISTNTVDILTGEITTVNQSGYLTNAVTGGDKLAVNFDNAYNGIHLGISEYLNNLFNAYTSSPIFVFKDRCSLEQIHLIPENKLLIWFEQNVRSGTMSLNIRDCTGGSSMSELIELSLEEQDVIRVEYVQGKWKKL